MIMKPLQPFLAALLLASATAHGAIFPSGTVNIAIPDANPNGISSTINVSGLRPSISDVNVTINVSGGFNGDLYAYLNYNGILVPLLNRVGTTTSPLDPFGYSTAGFNNVTLDDAASGGSIHNVANPESLPTVSYTPDGGSLASFNNSNPNGNWTIFFADMASGGGTSRSTLVSWSLEITAVPEPVNVALGIFAGVFGIVILARSRPVRNRVQRWRVAAVQWINAV
jgi:subtilisin-like proprotein convertase family protein